jgi:hypothetical protein
MKRHPVQPATLEVAQRAGRGQMHRTAVVGVQRRRARPDTSGVVQRAGRGWARWIGVRA